MVIVAECVCVVIDSLNGEHTHFGFDFYSPFTITHTLSLDFGRIVSVEMVNELKLNCWLYGLIIEGFREFN